MTKIILSIALALSLFSTTAIASGETKKSCVTQKDAKTGKEKEVCKNIKVHKKLEVSEDKKKK
jgi:hypothetical protein